MASCGRDGRLRVIEPVPAVLPPELLTYAFRIADLLASTDHPVVPDGLDRSLSGVQIQTFSTASSSAAMRAADASASSASSSIIGQTATPMAASASSSG